MSGSEIEMVDLIDPPAGGPFGFPKPFIGADGVDLGDWLVANGYPREWVDRFPGGVPCRILSCPVNELWRFGLGDRPA